LTFLGLDETVALPSTRSESWWRSLFIHFECLS